MKKFWALIITYRPHIYALGKHDSFDKAEEMAVQYCERKNEENRQEHAKELQVDPEAEEPAPYRLDYIMDESDLRSLIGEVHRPLVIPQKRAEVEVGNVATHGGCGGNCRCNRNTEDNQ